MNAPWLDVGRELEWYDVGRDLVMETVSLLLDEEEPDSVSVGIWRGGIEITSVACG